MRSLMNYELRNIIYEISAEALKCWQPPAYEPHLDDAYEICDFIMSCVDDRWLEIEAVTELDEDTVYSEALHLTLIMWEAIYPEDTSVN